MNRIFPFFLPPALYSIARGDLAAAALALSGNSRPEHELEHEGVLPQEPRPCAERWVAFGSRARCLLLAVVLAA